MNRGRMVKIEELHNISELEMQTGGAEMVRWGAQHPDSSVVQDRAEIIVKMRVQTQHQ
jgi:hypothetical protein